MQIKEKLRRHDIQVSFKTTTNGSDFRVGRPQPYPMEFSYAQTDSTTCSRGRPLAWGYHRLRYKLGVSPALVHSGYHQRFAKLFRAMIMTKHSPPQLELGTVHGGLPLLELQEKWLQPAKEIDGYEPFGSLTTLKLCLVARDYYYSNPLSPREIQHGHALRSLHAALDAAPRLRTLRLEIGIDLSSIKMLAGTTLRGIFRDANKTLMNIRHLELIGHSIDPDELLAMLVARKESLRTLRLSWIERGQVSIDSLDGTYFENAQDDALRLKEGARDSANLRAAFEEALPQCSILDWYHVYGFEMLYSIERSAQDRYQKA